MPSTKEYLDFILEQFSLTDGITYRAMMGEYILYRNGRIFGGIYDDRLLVKPVSSAAALMPKLCAKSHTRAPRKCFSLTMLTTVSF